MQQRSNGDVMSKIVIVDNDTYTTKTMIHMVDNASYECVAIRQYANGDVGLVHLSGDGRFVATRIYKHGNVVFNFNFNDVDAMRLYSKLCSVDDGELIFDGELQKVGE